MKYYNILHEKFKDLMYDENVVYNIFTNMLLYDKTALKNHNRRITSEIALCDHFKSLEYTNLSEYNLVRNILNFL